MSSGARSKKSDGGKPYPRVNESGRGPVPQLFVLVGQIWQEDAAIGALSFGGARLLRVTTLGEDLGRLGRKSRLSLPVPWVMG